MADRRYAVVSMEKEEASLESVFLHLTEEAEASAKATKNKKSRKKAEEPDRDGEYELIEEEETR